ncbi:pfkB-like carbohydrate kinase family protein, partial [Prunus dulcis]
SIEPFSRSYSTRASHFVDFRSSCIAKCGAWSLMLIKHGINSGFGAIYMLASSPVLRRQQFLIRSLGDYSDQNANTHQKRMQGIKFTSGASLEADAENVLRAITPTLDPNRHKGQAGKIAVIGGCREYTGAPYFAAISALKIGADLSHVFCTKDAAAVIKSYSPELIVHPVLEESYGVRDDEKRIISGKVLAEVAKWMERFDCLVIGPGLGRDPFLLDCVSKIIKLARKSNVPIVIDGDGLFLVTNSLDLISGYPLAVLTPNVNEYKRLVQKVLSCEVNDEEAHEQLLSLAKRIGGVTILRKGKSDFISDGETVKSVSIYGSPRRCGGQVSLSKNPATLGCIAGSALMRKAASLAFDNKKRSTLTTDIIEYLGRSLEDICPVR